MLPTGQVLSAEQRRLIKLFGQLGAEDRHALVTYAEFLTQRKAAEVSEASNEMPADPLEIPRPDSESVVGAIKRLSKRYFMLDRSTLLNETSSLMTSHVIHGRPAPQVIDELELLFERRYREHLEFRNNRGE